MTMQDGFPSFLDPSDILNESPELTFFGFQDQFARGGAQGRQSFQEQFKPFFNTFLGALSQDIQQGGGAERTFQDFANQNLESFLGGLPPSIRGATTSRFAPSARFFNI